MSEQDRDRCHAVSENGQRCVLFEYHNDKGTDHVAYGENYSNWEQWAPRKNPSVRIFDRASA